MLIGRKIAGVCGGIDSLSADATLRSKISKVPLDRIDVRGIGGVAKSAAVIDLILREWSAGGLQKRTGDNEPEPGYKALSTRG